MEKKLTNNQAESVHVTLDEPLAFSGVATDNSPLTYNRQTQFEYPTRAGSDPLRVTIELRRVTEHEQNCHVIYFNIHGDKHPYEVLQKFPNNYMGRETYNPALLGARDFIQKHVMIAAASSIEKLGLKDAVSESGSGAIFSDDAGDPIKTFWLYNGSSAQLRFPFKDSIMDWCLEKATAAQVVQIYEGVVQTLADDRAAIQDLIHRDRFCQPSQKPERQDLEEYNTHIADCWFKAMNDMMEIPAFRNHVAFRTDVNGQTRYMRFKDPNP